MVESDNVGKIESELIDHLTDLVEKHDASPEDISYVFSNVWPGMSPDEAKAAVASMSPTQRGLTKDIIGSVKSGEINRLFLRRRLLGSHETQPNYRGVNAERFLHFVMEPESVEECVGDALERLDEFQERYGIKYAVFHYRWTIVCLFLHAVWRKSPIARVLSAVLMKIDNK